MVKCPKNSVLGDAHGISHKHPFRSSQKMFGLEFPKPRYLQIETLTVTNDHDFYKAVIFTPAVVGSPVPNCGPLDSR